jgi:hypothetical protein
MASMSTPAFVVVVGILLVVFVGWFRTQRVQPRFVRVIVPIVLIAVGVVSAISAFSTRDDVTVPERLRIVKRDRALSAIPPGATVKNEGGNECPDYGGPYYVRHYSYEGARDSVFRFYAQRLKEDGWEPLTPSTTAPPSPTSGNSPSSTTGGASTSLATPWPTQPQPPPTSNSYSKSYGKWEALATVHFSTTGLRRRPQPFQLTVTVADDEATAFCVD